MKQSTKNKVLMSIVGLLFLFVHSICEAVAGYVVGVMS